MPNAKGSILHGGTDVPIFGANGRILFSDGLKDSALIVIDWGDDDVDICAYWAGTVDSPVAGTDKEVGYGWHVHTEDNGYEQYWETNDNITGGPEKVLVGVADGVIPDNAMWKVHLNWFHGGPGTATVTVYWMGQVQTDEFAVSRRNNNKADRQDCGAIVVFQAGGAIRITPFT